MIKMTLEIGGYTVTHDLNLQEGPAEYYNNYEACVIGEFLREVFFKQDRSMGDLGCYTTFDLRDNISRSWQTPVEDEPRLKWTHARLDVDNMSLAEPKQSQIEMRYYWDGDGCLEFIFPNGSCVVNTDCKKEHTWEYYNAR